MTGGTDLLEALNEALKKGHVPDELKAALKLALNPPLAPSVEAARQACALVRRFDKDLYAELVKPVTGAPLLR